ncbi:hypothetical protein TNCV_2222811 [Trichonephila clavipes]|nr:hypothetical protein TNCV_2222811 [Trichonephila clavipes]
MVKRRERHRIWHPFSQLPHHQLEEIRAIDRFSVYRTPTRRVFSGTGLELMTRQLCSDTLTTWLPRPLAVPGLVAQF